MSDLVILTKHAKKRLKQRVSKNVQDVADKAWVYGLSPKDCPRSLKSHINYLVEKQTGGVDNYRIYYGKVYLFCGRTLITVMNLPYKQAKLARKLTQKNRESN